MQISPVGVCTGARFCATAPKHLRCASAGEIAAAAPCRLPVPVAALTCWRKAGTGMRRQRTAERFAECLPMERCWRNPAAAAQWEKMRGSPWAKGGQGGWPGRAMKAAALPPSSWLLFCSRVAHGPKKPVPMGVPVQERASPVPLQLGLGGATAAGWHCQPLRQAHVLPYAAFAPISARATRRRGKIHQRVRAIHCVPVSALNQITLYKKENGIFTAAPVMLLQLGLHYSTTH